MPKNVIQHHEWSTRDPKRLQAFYGRIFDWKFSEAMPGYTMIDGVGGIYTPTDPQVPTGVVNYVTVDDIEKKEALITAAGGQIFTSKQEIPGMGWFAVFGDPDGNMVAMYQAMAKPKPKAAPKKAKAKKPAKKTRSAKKAKSSKKKGKKK